MNQHLNDESKSVECISKSNPILTISMSKEAKIVIRTEFSTSLQVLEILITICSHGTVKRTLLFQ